MTSAEVVAYVKERIDKTELLSSICEEVGNLLCLSGQSRASLAKSPL
jgi:hypothetical protein